MNEPQCPAAEVQCLAFTVAMHLVFCTLMYDDNNYDSLITQTPRGLTLTIDKFVNAQKDTQKVITTRRASHQQTCALTAVECVDTNLKVNADLFIYGLKEFDGDGSALETSQIDPRVLSKVLHQLPTSSIIKHQLYLLVHVG